MALQHLLLLRVVTVLQLIHTISASNNTDSNGNITYPAATANLTFNYLDCVKVAYTTQWSAGVNLWLFCHLSTNSPWARYYQTYYNPLTQSGVYTIEQIGNPVSTPTLSYLSIRFKFFVRRTSFYTKPASS